MFYIIWKAQYNIPPTYANYTQKERYWTGRPLTEVKWLLFKIELYYSLAHCIIVLIADESFEMRYILYQFSSQRASKIPEVELLAFHTYF